MATQLPKESFLAIAAVAWADGRMKKDEAAGLQRAAKENGLDEEGLAAVAATADEKVELDGLDLGGLNDWQGALTYAFANWLARLDGVVNAEEVKSLRALGERTGLADRKLQAARSAAFDVAMLPGGDRPDKYDFAAVEERLKEKLPATYNASVPPASLE